LGIRDKKLIQEVQRMAHDRRTGLYIPRRLNDVRRAWPVCQTCRRDVEAFEFKNWNAEGVELWARCHGKEDWYTIKYPYRITEGVEGPVINEHTRMAIRAFRPFEPTISLG